MATENNIGENIKKRRTKLGLSQEIFAQKSGVKYTSLTEIEERCNQNTICTYGGKNCESP